MNSQEADELIADIETIHKQHLIENQEALKEIAERIKLQVDTN